MEAHLCFKNKKIHCVYVFMIVLNTSMPFFCQYNLKPKLAPKLRFKTPLDSSSCSKRLTANSFHSAVSNNVLESHFTGWSWVSWITSWISRPKTSFWPDGRFCENFHFLFCTYLLWSNILFIYFSSVKICCFFYYCSHPSLMDPVEIFYLYNEIEWGMLLWSWFLSKSIVFNSIKPSIGIEYLR